MPDLPPYVEAREHLPVRATVRGRLVDAVVLGWRDDRGLPDLALTHGQPPRMGAGGRRAGASQSPSARLQYWAHAPSGGLSLRRHRAITKAPACSPRGVADGEDLS